MDPGIHLSSSLLAFRRLRFRTSFALNAGGLENLAPPGEAIASIFHALPQKAPAPGKSFAPGQGPLAGGVQAQGRRLRERRSRVPQITLRPPVPPCLACGTACRRLLAPTSRLGLHLGRVVCHGDFGCPIDLYGISLGKSRNNQHHRRRKPTNGSHMKLFGQGLPDLPFNEPSKGPRRRRRGASSQLAASTIVSTPGRAAQRSSPRVNRFPPSRKSNNLRYCRRTTLEWMRPACGTSGPRVRSGNTKPYAL